MAEDLKVEFEKDYIHILHGEGFEITPAKTEELWAFLEDLCKRHDCSRVLAEGPAPKRKMDTVAAFQSGVQAAGIGDLWLAVLFHDYEPDELSELFERSARNRGVHIKFFTDRERALKWLGVA